MTTKLFNNFLLSLLCLSYVLGNKLENAIGTKSEETGKEDPAKSLMNEVHCFSNSSTDQIGENLADFMVHKFDLLQRMILDLKENINIKLVVLENVLELENNLNRKIDNILKKIPDSEGNINQKLDVLEKKIDKKLEDNLNRILDEIKNKSESKKRTNEKINELENEQAKLEESANHTLDIIDKVFNSTNLLSYKLDILMMTIPKLEKKINRLSNIVEASIIRSGCKQYLAHGYRYEHIYPIDGLVFDHVTLQKDYNNDILHYETHIAIKSDKDGIILLSPVANPGPDDLVFELGVGIAKNQYTVLRITMDSSNEVVRATTPNILSATSYTAFYIKISNGVLTFGKEGDSSSLIAYTDKRVSTIKYIGISSWGSNDAKFLYDCPANVKGSMETI